MNTLLSMIGLCLAVTLYEVDVHLHYFSKIDYNEFKNALDHPRVNNPWTHPMRIAIACCSILSIVFCLLRHYYKKTWINEFFLEDAYDKKRPNLFI